MKGRNWAIIVQFGDGHEDFVCAAWGDEIQPFRTKEAAEDQAEFLRIGLDQRDRVLVVPFPSLSRRGHKYAQPWEDENPARARRPQ